MRRGKLGLPRPLGLGPLNDGGILFGQPENADQMNSEVEQITDELGIPLDTQDPDEVQQVLDELATRVFPESERKQERLKNCIESNWADNWTEGFLENTGMEGTNDETEGGESVDSSPLEELSTAANGCRGMVEANTLG